MLMLFNDIIFIFSFSPVFPKVRPEECIFVLGVFRMLSLLLSTVMESAVSVTLGLRAFIDISCRFFSWKSQSLAWQVDRYPLASELELCLWFCVCVFLSAFFHLPLCYGLCVCVLLETKTTGTILKGNEREFIYSWLMSSVHWHDLCYVKALRSFSSQFHSSANQILYSFEFLILCELCEWERNL